MKTQDFDFDLPDELIAQSPLEQRAHSKMLHLDGVTSQFCDALFTDLPNYLRAGDVLVFNDTRVMNARLFGKKESGGKIEVMVERILNDHHVLAVIRASHAPKIGTKLLLADHIPVIVMARDDAFYTLHFVHNKTVIELLDEYGSLPLPPYITRQATDIDTERYQTVYAKNSGAVAAPTAGLHFDALMLEKLQSIGVLITYITLHVGAGTFQPVRAEHIADHKMHHETFHIPPETVDAIQNTKKTGGRIMAIGTTSLRALEASAFNNEGVPKSGYGETNIFITPGFRLNVVERLFTNFHLPRSTLLMLVSAFAGMDNIQRAYQHAIEQRYRFFSYGDAMLIERKP